MVRLIEDRFSTLRPGNFGDVEVSFSLLVAAIEQPQVKGTVGRGTYSLLSYIGMAGLGEASYRNPTQGF
jgi:hypothetical protein